MVCLVVVDGQRRARREGSPSTHHAARRSVGQPDVLVHRRPGRQDDGSARRVRAASAIGFSGTSLSSLRSESARHHDTLRPLCQKRIRLSRRAAKKIAGIARMRGVRWLLLISPDGAGTIRTLQDIPRRTLPYGPPATMMPRRFFCAIPLSIQRVESPQYENTNHLRCKRACLVD